MAERTDEEIRREVVTALGAASVDALTIAVGMDGGIVDLRGEVASHSERLAAVELARAISAPARVRSELTVAPLGEDFSLTDADVAVEVGRALVQSDVSAASISFDVRNRVVTLTGGVDRVVAPHEARRKEESR